MVSVRAASPDDLRTISRLKTRALRSAAASHYDTDQVAVIAPESPDPDAYRSVLEHPSFALVVAEVNDGVDTELLAHRERRAADAGPSELHVLSTLNAVGFYAGNGYTADALTEIGETPASHVVRLTKGL